MITLNIFFYLLIELLFKKVIEPLDIAADAVVVQRSHLNCTSVMSEGSQDHWAAGGLVLRTPVPGHKGILHMAQAQ